MKPVRVRIIEMLDRLEQSTGLKLSAIAVRAGMTPSTLTRYRNTETKHELSTPTLEKLRAAFPDFFATEADFRAPPIEPSPLSHNGRVTDVSLDFLPPLANMRRDIPVYGTALGAALEVTENGGPDTTMIEQATLDTGETLDWLRRTPALADRRAVYGVIVTGESMAPRFQEAESVLVDPRSAPRLGDDVIVQLRAPDGQDGEDRVVAVLIKRLCRRNAAFVELEQFNPPARFRLEMSRVSAIHRILPLHEVIGI